MGETSKIGWTDSTFNPWIGCTKVGPGCDNCYAEALDKRMKYGGATHWGAGVPRFRTSSGNWDKVLKWNEAAKASGHTHRVFCASLADVFDNEVDPAWRVSLFKLINETPHLSWLVLTKRIGNVMSMVPRDWLTWSKATHQWLWPDNLRILITVVNQEEAERDIPKLLQLPCKNGISYEPAIGPIDWDNIKQSYRRFNPFTGEESDDIVSGRVDFSCVNWVIVGGESGPHARPFDLEWAYSTVNQCKAVGVPVFVKQLGSKPRQWLYPGRRPTEIVTKDRAGADPAEWPADLRVQEFPE